MPYKLPIPDIDGAASMSNECRQWLWKMARKMKTVVEVGSYKGRSTHAILSGCNGMVYAVDNWLDKKGNMRVRTFWEFMKNVGKFPNLAILKMDSVKAANSFFDKSIDMVFIDGDHSYKGITADINAWLPKTRKLICGHDFHGACPGILQAVPEIFGDRFKVVPKTNIWYVDLIKDAQDAETVSDPE